jgi:hypothetical protein
MSAAAGSMWKWTARVPALNPGYGVAEAAEEKT